MYRRLDTDENHSDVVLEKTLATQNNIDMMIMQNEITAIIGKQIQQKVESEMQNVFCNCILNKDKLRFVMKNRKSSEFLLRCPGLRAQPSPNNSAVDFRKMHDQACNTLNVAGKRRLECSSPPLIRSLSQEAALHQRVRACMSEWAHVYILSKFG